VRLSRDEGKTWPAAKRACEGGSAYGNLVVLPDGTIGCLFERAKPTRQSIQTCLEVDCLVSMI